MAEPTREDATLTVQLAQWGSSTGIGDAMPKVFSALTKRDLLSAELVRDWLWVEGIWARVGPAALRQRERFGEPRLYENFEALATG